MIFFVNTRCQITANELIRIYERHVTPFNIRIDVIQITKLTSMLKNMHLGQKLLFLKHNTTQRNGPQRNVTQRNVAQHNTTQYYNMNNIWKCESCELYSFLYEKHAINFLKITRGNIPQWRFLWITNCPCQHGIWYHYNWVLHSTNHNTFNQCTFATFVNDRLDVISYEITLGICINWPKCCNYTCKWMQILSVIFIWT